MLLDKMKGWRCRTSEVHFLCNIWLVAHENMTVCRPETDSKQSSPPVLTTAGTHFKQSSPPILAPAGANAEELSPPAVITPTHTGKGQSAAPVISPTHGILQHRQLQSRCRQCPLPWQCLSARSRLLQTCRVCHRRTASKHHCGAWIQWSSRQDYASTG